MGFPSRLLLLGLVPFLAMGLGTEPSFAAPRTRWSEEQANAWYARQPWLVGSNYIPATASNQFEMWQSDTFDPKRIDLELGWAESLGMNTVRVFLHDLLWQQDAKGFRHRVNKFLEIADRHHIRTIFVPFDSCFDPSPHPGKQREPRPGVMMTSWAQSPGAAALKDASQYPRLEAYVEGVVGAFAHERRILAWNVWNEPTNDNGGSYAAEELPNKTELVAQLLPRSVCLGAQGKSHATFDKRLVCGKSSEMG